MKLTLTAFLALAAPVASWAAPTQIAQETFDAGGIGFTTSVPQFIEVGQGNLFSDFFSVLPNNGSKISGSRTLAGADGEGTEGVRRAGLK